MKTKSKNICAILFGLTTQTLLVQSINFDRNLFGVVFMPEVKFKENGQWILSSNYTLQNLKTMLEIVSTKFTRIFVPDLGLSGYHFVKNHTYYNTELTTTRTAEAAAIINCERNNKSMTVIIGINLDSWGMETDIYTMSMEAQFKLAAEAVQISHSIYPGTVTGLQLNWSGEWALNGIQTILLWIQKLRVITTRLGLKTGVKLRHTDLYPEKRKVKHEHVDPNTIPSLTSQILYNCDFIVYDYGVTYVEFGADFNFSDISSKVMKFRKSVAKINRNIELMWYTYLYGKPNNFEIMKNYWEVVNRYAIEEKIPVWLEGAFESPRYSWIGWKLRRNDFINDISGYNENDSGKPVYMNHSSKNELCEIVNYNAILPLTQFKNLDAEDSSNLKNDVPQSFASNDNSTKFEVIANKSDVFIPDLSSSEDEIFSVTIPYTWPELGFSNPERSQNATSSVHSTPDNNYIIIIISCLAGGLALFGLTCFCIIRRRKFLGLATLTRRDISESKFGVPTTTIAENFERSFDIDVPAFRLHYDEYFEIPKARFKILWDERLGRGEFGLVYKAILINGAEEDKDVAVKLPKQDSISFAVKGLLSEIKILTHLGQHPNIVSICGAYTAEVDKGVVYVALELCQLGSLKNYLKKLKTGDESNYDFSVPMPSTSGNRGNFVDPNVAVQLIRWSNEIACGMEHLEKKNVLHADLATRNVLLTANKTAKVTDFGLSKRLYQYSNYKRRSETPLPWRWLPLESLKNHEFSVKSDVWSYGVTLWEIFSFGDLPFPERTWNNEFMKDLENGLRLDQPTNTPIQIYELMNCCWNLASEKRPNFAECQAQTKHILEEEVAKPRELDGGAYSDVV